MQSQTMFSLAVREIMGFLLKQQQHIEAVKGEKMLKTIGLNGFFARRCLIEWLARWKHVQGENTMNTVVSAIIAIYNLQFFRGGDALFGRGALLPCCALLLFCPY